MVRKKGCVIRFAQDIYAKIELFQTFEATSTPELRAATKCYSARICMDCLESFASFYTDVRRGLRIRKGALPIARSAKNKPESLTATAGRDCSSDYQRLGLGISRAFEA